MKIYLQANHTLTGIHRFLESLTIHEDFEIVITKTLREAAFSHEAFIVGGFLPNQLDSITNCDIYYTFCSPFGQMDLSGASGQFYSPEFVVLYHLLERIRNGKIKNAITQSKSLADRFGFIYIPPVRLGVDVDKYYTTERNGYGFLGNNARKHKNAMNQIAAMSSLTPKQKIVMGYRTPQKEILETAFECEIVIPDLSTDDLYFKEIATHSLCYQCSWSEAFDYQAFEYCLLGVPVIHSPALDWLQAMQPEYLNSLEVKNPDSYSELLEAGNKIMGNKCLYDYLSERLKALSHKFNEDNKEKLYEVCEGICG